MLVTYAGTDTPVESGDPIKSRTGEFYIFRRATSTATPTAFGRIRATRMLNPRTGAVAGSEHEFTDFAFGLNVR
jgi:hypothetical protein